MTTIPRFLSRAVLPLLFAALAAGSADIATAQSDPLEGKTFEGVFLQRGKTRGIGSACIGGGQGIAVIVERM